MAEPTRAMRETAEKLLWEKWANPEVDERKDWAERYEEEIAAAALGIAAERAEEIKRLQLVANDWDGQGHVVVANAFRAHAFALGLES